MTVERLEERREIERVDAGVDFGDLALGVGDASRSSTILAMRAATANDAAVAKWPCDSSAVMTVAAAAASVCVSSSACRSAGGKQRRIARQQDDGAGLAFQDRPGLQQRVAGAQLPFGSCSDELPQASPRRRGRVIARGGLGVGAVPDHHGHGGRVQRLPQSEARVR